MTTDDIAAWLQSHGITDTISTEGHIPTQPDRLIVLNLRGGPGERRERSFDVRSLQVLARGLQRSQTDAEALATALDDIFLGATRTTIGSTYVASITRSGGPPTLLERERNSGRVTMACSYLLEVGRTVF